MRDQGKSQGLRDSGTIAPGGELQLRVYRDRLVDGLLAELLSELPGVLVVGPRASGKTTTAVRHARTVVQLDREAEAVAFRADPDAALRGLPEPVLLDEWQAAPAVLGAVKRAIDAEPRPGRFLITGSACADLDAEVWPATGRLVRVSMYGMTYRELTGRLEGAPILDHLEASGPLRPLDLMPDEVPDLRGYVALALRGGFPEPALRLSESARVRWFESYVEQLLTRDAEQLGVGRDPVRLRRYFEAYALNSAGVVDDKTLYDAAAVDRKTALAYERLLENLLVVESTPAWASNRLKRLGLSSKRYVVDPALIGAVLRLDENAVLRDGDLLGRLLDTFVAAQLRAELVVSSSRPRLYHVRQRDGRHEIDMLAELAAQRVVAIEVKASSAPKRDDARHLIWLREQLGARYVAGLLLHTGPHAYRLDERVAAVPIAALWT
jgi:predicted AAA+ superfamily ATPase